MKIKKMRKRLQVDKTAARIQSMIKVVYGVNLPISDKTTSEYLSKAATWLMPVYKVPKSKKDLRRLMREANSVETLAKLICYGF